LTRIVTDINYDRIFLDRVFKCQLCHAPLLMFGCENPDCDNYNSKRIMEEDAKKKAFAI
jgi:hypothetical protein